MHAITEPARYDRFSIALHWLSALLVLALWVLGQTIDWFSPGPGRVNARSLHIALGLALLGVLALRVIWAWAGQGWGAVRPPPLWPGLWGQLARHAHTLLYLLLALAALGGLFNAWIRADTLFGLFDFASPLPGDRAARHTVGDVHALLANALLILAGLHAAASLFHHLILRDTTLRRMLPEPASRRRAE